MIGRWLEVNGEAIYGTRPWKVYGEGPTQVIGGEFKDTMGEAFTSQDIRFTTKGDILYAIALAVPKEEMVIQSLSTNLRLYPEEVDNVQLLGSDEPVKWSRNEKGLTIKMPVEKPCNYAIVIKIISSRPIVTPRTQ